MEPQFKSGYVAIIGEPNVGKSTLLNALLQQKLSIVTPKPQTTRQRVLGILSTKTCQIIFLDTPGLLNPRYLLQKKMMLSAELAINDADLILVMTDLSHGLELPEPVEQILQRSRGIKECLLVINKIDIDDKKAALPMIDAFSQRNQFTEIIPISALKLENLDDLLKTIERKLPEHPPYYPLDEISEQPERFFVAELIREKIFEMFWEEIPYSTAVEILEFKERAVGKTLIRADIIVERDSQKGILIGKRAEALKTLGEQARGAIESFIQKPVFLELHVKVKEKWRENEAQLKRLGYSPD
ncbi:MAG: GTPase Era [bacterium]